MLLLRSDGGMHTGVHRTNQGAVSRSLDLRPLLGSSERRDLPVGEADRHGRGLDSAHELLQEVQLLCANESDRSFDLRYEAALEAEPRFTESDAVYSKQPCQSRRRRKGSQSFARSKRKLLLNPLQLRKWRKNKVKKTRGYGNKKKGKTLPFLCSYYDRT